MGKPRKARVSIPPREYRQDRTRSGGSSGLDALRERFEGAPGWVPRSQRKKR